MTNLDTTGGGSVNKGEGYALPPGRDGALAPGFRPSGVSPCADEPFPEPAFSVEGLSPFQTTLVRPVAVEGTGLHKGQPVRMMMRPALPHTGIVFRRTDLDGVGTGITDIPARYDAVCDTTLCTVLGNVHGTSVATVEHVMAALAGCGVDNALIEIDGPETPVMDGSAEAFVQMIRQAGLEVSDVPRRAIRILEPVRVEDGLKTAALLPHDGFSIELGIDFDHAAIGRQFCRADIAAHCFEAQLSRARTFGFYRDYEALRAQGLALGGSLDNAVVLDEDSVLNAEGLRFEDEFVRHKTLDALGDLALAGAPVIGLYRSERAGHAMNNRILRTLFEHSQAWQYVTLVAPPGDKEMPGVIVPLCAD